MPHKRNPIISERVAGLARVMRADALAALENIALWGERDITHSSVERVIVPDATSLLEYMTRKLAEVIEGLRVSPDRMRENLERTGGLVFSHRVLLALIARGLGREEAYRLVQSAATRALEGRGRFRDLIRESGALPDAELEACFDAAAALRHVDAIFTRLGLSEAPAEPPSGTPNQGGTHSTQGLPAGIPDRGRVLTGLSAFWFGRLRDIVPNHFISTDPATFPPAVHAQRQMLAGRSMLVRRLRPIGIECVVRGYLAGSAWKEYA